MSPIDTALQLSVEAQSDSNNASVVMAVTNLTTGALQNWVYKSNGNIQLLSDSIEPFCLDVTGESSVFLAESGVDRILPL